MTDTQDKIVAGLDKKARGAGLTDAARAVWVKNTATLCHINAEGKIRRADNNKSPRKMLEALRASNPDAFTGAPKSNNNGVTENPFAAGPGPEGDALRAEYIRKMGTAKAASMARAANCDIAGRPLKPNALNRIGQV